jgi:triphosphoribosyl-dephospho-CoA synthase
MKATLPGTELAFLAQAACLLEASTRKPGNVGPGRDFADMRYEDFLLSAAAIGPAFARAPELGVGRTVLAAVRATRERVSVNTNLGLVLLLAPLACAAGLEGGALDGRVRRVLGALSVDDAEAAYEAIRLVGPGGLGDAPAEDVATVPTRTLREVMVLARDRDAIANEYASDYDRTFRLTAPALRRARSAGGSWPDAILEAFLQVLGEVPDTLIARKRGPAAAERVSAGAARVLAAGGVRAQPALADFDASLRADGNALNPGTTADLVTAVLFVALLEGML